MYKQLVVCPYNAKLLNNKNKETIGMLNKLKSQRDLKIITLSEKKKPHGTRSVYCMILFTWNSKKCKLIHSDRKQISGCLWILAEGGMDYKGAGGKFRQREVIVNLITVMVSRAYTFVKTDKIVHCKYVQCIVLQYYLLSVVKYIGTFCLIAPAPSQCTGLLLSLLHI